MQVVLVVKKGCCLVVIHVAVMVMVTEHDLLGHTAFLIELAAAAAHGLRVFAYGAAGWGLGTAIRNRLNVDVLHLNVVGDPIRQFLE